MNTISGLIILSTALSLGNYINSDTSVGVIYNIKADNIGPMYAYKSNDNTPKGYIKGSYKISKFDYYDTSKNDITLLSFNMSFVPGAGASIDSICEKGWLLSKAQLKVDIFNNGGMPVFIYASPHYSGFNEYTITSTAGSTFGTVRKDAGIISLDEAFKIESSNEITKNYNFGQTISYIEAEPRCSSAQGESINPSYYRKYEYDWSRNECRIPLNQTYLLAIENQNITQGKNLGIRVKANAYLHCNKDWFSGDAYYNSDFIDLYL